MRYNQIVLMVQREVSFGYSESEVLGSNVFLTIINILERTERQTEEWPKTINLLV